VLLLRVFDLFFVLLFLCSDISILTMCVIRVVRLLIFILVIAVLFDIILRVTIIIIYVLIFPS